MIVALLAITIDGKIALNTVEKSTSWTSKEDFEFLKKIERKSDVLICGRKTFMAANDSLQKQETIVFTSKVNGSEEKNNVVFFNPEKEDIFSYLGEKGYSFISLLGGQGVYSYFLERNKIDELYITIEPLMFGKGIEPFRLTSKKNFELLKVEKLNDKGTLLLHYKLIA